MDIKIDHPKKIVDCYNDLYERVMYILNDMDDSIVWILIG